MAIKRLRSRIHSHFTEQALKDLNRVCMDRTISDNNQKADIILSVLDKHGVDYSELGPGTNRMVVLIDNYAYKIAMDPQGKRDNINEFKISQEMQPYVVKTYETNDLISVHEYITVISQEEFVEKLDEIRKVLAVLGETYLLGDVGTKARNFCNWGYRDDGTLVILDFAHIYRINPDQIICQLDQSILQYDRDFHDMVCPQCGRKYQFMQLRRLISLETEQMENQIARELSYKLTSPMEEFKEESTNVSYSGREFEERPSRYNIYSDEEESEEDDDMSRGEEDFSKEAHEESYEETVELMKRIKNDPTYVPPVDASLPAGDAKITTTVTDTTVTSAQENSHVRTYKQVTEITTAAESPATEYAGEDLESAIRENAYEDALNEVLSKSKSFTVSEDPIPHEGDIIIKPDVLEEVVESYEDGRVVDTSDDQSEEDNQYYGRPVSSGDQPLVIIANEPTIIVNSPADIITNSDGSEAVINVSGTDYIVGVDSSNSSALNWVNEVITSSVDEIETPAPVEEAQPQEEPVEDQVQEETESPEMVTVVKTEERIIVDGEIVHDHSTIEVKSTDDVDPNEAERKAIAAQLLAEDQDYERLEEEAEQDRIDAANRQKRGGNDRWV